ncbi:hypothetical protein [Thermococcus sp.]
MRLAKWLLVILVVCLFVPTVSARYYVVLDESLSYLQPYAEKIAELHNGSVVVSNFSNLGFLNAGDYALFIVERSRFNGGFVYSIYSRLDFNGDGIYDPVVGFLPIWGVDDLVRFYWALTSFKPGRPVFLQIGKVSYTDYIRLSKNASLVWVEGHGSPEGVSMGSWGLYPSNLGDVSGKAFVLESCDVGKFWETEDSLVMALINAGSPAVVASIDMGGVSYLSNRFWASGYPLGKLVQISNAYFTKVGVPPKVVLYGDPAVVPVNSSEYTLVKSPATGVYARIFPNVNGYIYTPGKPSFGAIIRAYGGLFSVMDVWRGIFTMKGFGPLIILATIVILLTFSRPKRKDVLLGSISALASLLILGAFTGYPSAGTLVGIILFWTVVALFMVRRSLLGLLTLFLPPAIITLMALLSGTTTPGYSVFILVVSFLSSLIIVTLLSVFHRILSRFLNT